MRAAVVTVSDRVSRGEAEDRSGPAVVDALTDMGFKVVSTRVVADGVESVQGALMALVEDVDLIVTTGGTGFGPRDMTPEATTDIVERRAPGLAEAMRSATFGENPHGMLSRGVAGIKGTTLILNLPGSVRGAVESLSVVAPALPHAIELLISAETDHNA